MHKAAKYIYLVLLVLFGNIANSIAQSCPAQPICPSESYTLTAAPSLSAYQWYKNGTAIVGATSQTYIADTIGNYSWAGTNATGCRDTSCCATPIVAATNCNPCAGVTPQSICPGETYTITAAAGLSAYQWYDNGTAIVGATSQTYIADTIGNYSWAATNATGCRDTSCCTTQIVASTNCNPCAGIAPTTYCPGESYSLDAGPGLSNIQWLKDGQPIASATSQIYIVTAIGSYTFTAAFSSTACPAAECCPIVFVSGVCCPAPICMPVQVVRL